MSSATSIATRRAAEEAILSGGVVPIANVEYTTEEFRNFFRSIVNCARPVATEIGGGRHGHIWLLEDQATFTTRTGGVGFVEAVRPDPADFTGVTTNAGLARIKEEHSSALEAHNTQEGVRTGLRRQIIANVPRALLVALEDADSLLDEVEPRVLIATLKAGAAPVTVVDAQTLKAVRDKRLTFDDETPLATQFALVKKAIADLHSIHHIVTSESELTMEWYSEIEKEKDYEKQVEEFRARTTSNSFNDFITFFSARDVEVRRLNKLLPSRAKAMGYHSAANIQAIDRHIDEKVEEDMAVLAGLIEAALNAGAVDGSPGDQTSKPDSAANVADTFTKDNAVLDALKDIQDRLSKVEGGGGRRRSRGRDREKKDDGAKAEGEERKPCQHCGKRHVQPDNKCWKLEANKDARPKWMKDKDGGN